MNKINNYLSYLQEKDQIFDEVIQRTVEQLWDPNPIDPDGMVPEQPIDVPPQVVQQPGPPVVQPMTPIAPNELPPEEPQEQQLSGYANTDELISRAQQLQLQKDAFEKQVEEFDKQYEEAVSKGESSEFLKQNRDKISAFKKYGEDLDNQEEKLGAEYQFRRGSLPQHLRYDPKQVTEPQVGMPEEKVPVSSQPSAKEQIVGQLGLNIDREALAKIDNEYHETNTEMNMLKAQVRQAGKEIMSMTRSPEEAHANLQKIHQIEQGRNKLEGGIKALQQKLQQLNQQKTELYSNALRQKYADGSVPDLGMTSFFQHKPYYPEFQGGMPVPRQKLSI